MPDEQDPSEFSPHSFSPPSLERVAEMLPQYEIHFLIASGGMGAVYKGRQVELDRDVAIKVLPPSAGVDADSVERFRSEARAMAKLNHPGIVSIYDFGERDGDCYFAMEYVEGHNVYELLQEQTLTQVQAATILSAVSDALNYAHSKGVIHGDIKPANIVAAADGSVKLLDFGLARLRGGQNDSQHDEEWNPMGTPEYAAPELYERDSMADPRSDLYALGIVFYEMLVGKVPQGDFELPATALQLHPRVDEVIERCLRINPDERYQTGAELQGPLKSIIENKAIPRPTGHQPPTTARAGSINRPVRKPGGVRPVKRPGAVVPSLTGTASRIKQQAEKQKEKQQQTIIKVVVGSLIGIIGLIAFFNSSGNKSAQEKPATPPAETTPVSPEKPAPQAEAATPTPAPQPEKPPTPTPTPVEVAQPKPVEPTPEPAKTPPEQTPSDLDSAHPNQPTSKLIAEYTRRYQNEILGRDAFVLAEAGPKYMAALTKVNLELVGQGNTAGALEAETERKRFEKEKTPAVKSSAVPAVANLQKILSQQLLLGKEGIPVTIKKIQEDLSATLAKITLDSTLPVGDRDAAKALRTEALLERDYIGVLLGLVDNPQMVGGVYSKENFALARHGTKAIGPEKAEELNDGDLNEDHTAVGKVGDVFELQFTKAFRTSTIILRLQDKPKKGYAYTLAASADGKTWQTIGGSDDFVKGAQKIDAKGKAIKALRLTSTGIIKGSESFRVVEIEAYSPGYEPH